jgi:hypothetical protein
MMKTLVAATFDLLRCKKNIRVSERQQALLTLADKIKYR